MTAQVSEVYFYTCVGLYLDTSSLSVASTSSTTATPTDSLVSSAEERSHQTNSESNCTSTVSVNLLHLCLSQLKGLYLL